MVPVFAYLAVLFMAVTPTATSAGLQEQYYRRSGGKHVELTGLYESHVVVRDKWQCATSCLQNIYCFSFNFGPAGAGSELFECVHNVDTASSSGLALSARHGFFYYEQVQPSFVIEIGQR